MLVRYVKENDIKKYGLGGALAGQSCGAHHAGSILDNQNPVGTRLRVPVYGNESADATVISCIKPPRRAAHGQSGVYLMEPEARRGLPNRLVLKVYGDIEPDSTEHTLTYFMQASTLRTLGNAFIGNSRHPNVLLYYGDFYDPHTMTAAFAVGFVPSQTTVLHAIIQRRYTFRDAVQLGATVFRTVDNLGKQGIFHRDIKPQNILQPTYGTTGDAVTVCPEEAMFFDFDIAWNNKYAMADNVPRKDIEGKVLGTPGYIPPEMWRGECSLENLKGDVYSASATVFEAVTGQRLWNGFRDAKELLIATARAAKHKKMPNNVCALSRVAEPYGETGRIVKEALLGGLNPDPKKRFSADLLAQLFDSVHNALAEMPLGKTATGIYEGKGLLTICMDEGAAHTVLATC